MIKTIRVQNFRSLVDVSVELDPLTVLIGRSGTGKSNFVHAIRFLRDCLNLRTVRLDGLGGQDRALHVDHQNQPLAYDLQFSIKELDQSFRYFLETRSSDVCQESLMVGEKILFHHADGKWVHPPDVVPTPPPRGIMLGAIPGLQESTFAYVALRSGVGCYDFPDNVLLTSGREGQPADSGFSDSGDNYLLVADRILTDLTKAANWKRISRAVRAVDQTVAGLTLNLPVVDRIDVGHQLNGRRLSFDVRQESEGFRRFLAHLLALYQTPSKQTLLFEHPEAGLYPGALEALAWEFKACPRDGRGQVILTTHSPQLLDLFPPEAIRVVDIQDQVTRIGPVAPEQMTSLRENLLRPGELLTVDPARLAGQLAEVPG